MPDLAFEIAIGGSENAHIDLLGFCGTQGLKFPLLQNAQQLSLNLERQLSDLIQKEGSPIGQTKVAWLVGSRVGESIFDVTKKF